jgi:hypothetical protein
LKCIAYDLDQLRRAFGDYQTLAAKNDPLYQQWSPLLNEDQANSGLIEFSLDLEVPDDTTIARLGDMKKRVNTWFLVTSKGVKWALHTRRKTETVLSDFRRWNSKLKDIAAACMIDDVTRIASMPLSTAASRLAEVERQPDARSLGLGLPASLKRLTLEPATTTGNFDLHDYELVEPFEYDATLVLGEIKRNDGRVEKSLIEYKEFGEAVTQGNMTSVKQLASLLSTSTNSDLATLPFRGYIRTIGHSPRKDTYAFVFDFPSNTHQSDLTSLHAALNSASSKSAISLAKRFQLAETMTKAVWYLNTVGWIHKSIRSDNIVFFKNETEHVDFASPHLVGFEYARLESDMTEYTGFDEDLEKNLYRHPERQGPPTVRFQKTHDLYALGLVLLEIGLWRTLNSLLEDFQNTEAGSSGKRPLANPKTIMEYYQKVAAEDLPRNMGDAYAAAVSSCLTAVEESAGNSVSVYNDVVLKVGLDSLSTF